MWVVCIQVPAVYPILHGGGELYGIHALAAERQRTLQDLHHGEEFVTKLAVSIYAAVNIYSISVPFLQK